MCMLNVIHEWICDEESQYNPKYNAALLKLDEEDNKSTEAVVKLAPPYVENSR